MKRFYIIITCQILALLLFLSNHFLISIFYSIVRSDSIYFWMDFTLFMTIGLQIMIILLLISLEVNNKK